MPYTMLGVRIDTLSKPDALVKAREFLLATGQKKIYTPNPEMLVKAYNDQTFRDVLNRGDLNVCDGFGIRLFSGFIVQRISGVEMTYDLCALAENEGKSIFLMGTGNESIVAETAEALQKRFPKLKIAGFHRGPTVKEAPGNLVVDESVNAGVINFINLTKPDVLFVAFGMGKQEKWLETYLPQLLTVKLTVGVGGAFDFISGRVSRAPLLLRKIGLEWLYRLIRQPWRIGRIWNATVKFAYYVVRYGK